MGFPMAVNLRKKIGSEYKLLICDVSQDALSRFQSTCSETGPIEVISNGYEAAKTAVRYPP